MPRTIRVALPTYNALTATNPDHFALYADSEWILIKEKVRGSSSVSGSSTTSIAHGLAYVPFVLAFAEVSSGRWIYCVGEPSDYTVKAEADATYLYLVNGYVAAKTFKYFIFYDQIV